MKKCGATVFSCILLGSFLVDDRGCLGRCERVTFFEEVLDLLWIVHLLHDAVIARGSSKIADHAESISFPERRTFGNVGNRHLVCGRVSWLVDLSELVIRDDVECRIHVLVFEPVHPKMQIIERREPADEPVEFCYGCFGPDDDVVPLFAGPALLLPSETVADCPDAFVDVIAFVLFSSLSIFDYRCPAIRTYLVRRITFECPLVEPFPVGVISKCDVLACG